MIYKKMFFPIGGGDELEQRLYGATLVAKFFNVKLEILKCESNPIRNIPKSLNLPQHMQKEIQNIMNHQVNSEHNDFLILLKKVAKELDVPIIEDNSNNSEGIYLKFKEGFRSTLVKDSSKFSDLVIAAAPPLGISTMTFESALLESGKSVLMIPRILRKFDTKSIIIGWNNSAEASRAVTASIDLLKQAQRVEIVSSKEYMKDTQQIDELINYLKCHEIDASFKLVETTKIPGEALLNEALDGNFDLIVAGASGFKGLKELMFGGATKYLLQYSSIPVFMSR
mgnify:CR=1 FL=1